MDFYSTSTELGSDTYINLKECKNHQKSSVFWSKCIHPTIIHVITRLTLIINTFHFQSFGVKRREKKRGNTLRLVGGAHNWLEELKIGSSFGDKISPDSQVDAAF